MDEKEYTVVIEKFASFHLASKCYYWKMLAEESKPLGELCGLQPRLSLLHPCFVETFGSIVIQRGCTRKKYHKGSHHLHYRNLCLLQW